MKIRLTLALVVLALPAIAQMSPSPTGLPNPFGPPERQWAKLANGKPWGTTAGIEIGPHGEIWAIDRCGKASCDGSNMAAVHQIDPKTGRPIRNIGQGLFAMPHGLHVDKDGNVWVTDAAVAKQGGPKGEQVIKMNPDGKVLMRLGTAGVPGGGRKHFHDPGDVTTAPNGDIFVADGHGTVAPDLPPDTVTRIIKFSPDGKFIKAWGSLGSGKSQFRNPHALVIDSKGRLLVADRVNGRIQVFDQNGKWLTEYRGFNHPADCSFCPTTRSMPPTTTAKARRASTLAAREPERRRISCLMLKPGKASRWVRMVFCMAQRLQASRVSGPNHASS